jgi:O-antigen ligase
MARIDSGGRLGSVRFATMIALLAACFMFGGASRLDVLSLVVLQPFSVICAAVFLFSGGRLRWHVVGMPLLMLAALAAVMAVQLIPLPADVWLALPGHGVLKEFVAVAGPDTWRPISVTPDLTLASLVSLSVPAAVLTGFAALTPEQTRQLLPVLLLGSILSAIIGLAQIAGGEAGPLYFYAVTNEGSPVGLFSNRNHQAALLAMTFPMLALWASRPKGQTFSPARPVAAVAFGVFLLPIVLATGSRAGLALAALGLALAFAWRKAFSPLVPNARAKLLVGASVAVVGLAVVGAAVAFSRDETLQRLFGLSMAGEVRFEALLTILRITWDFFPVGSGFGSFDPVFRFYEPFEQLSSRYLNHAHNDLLELVMTGGVPALAVLVWFLGWTGKTGVAVLRHRGRLPSGEFARLALAIIVMLLLSSLVDYPLRTPMLSALLAVACGWLATHASQERELRSPRVQESALPSLR